MKSERLKELKGLNMAFATLDPAVREEGIGDRGQAQQLLFVFSGFMLYIGR